MLDLLLFSHSVMSDSFDPVNCSILGFPVLHHLLEFAQTHVHQVGDAISPSHPLSSPFSSCLQSFPASGSFLMSQFFALGGQIIGALASVLPMNIQGWFPLGLTGLISLWSKGTLKSLLQQHNSKASILQCSAFFMVQISHPYMTTGKVIALTIRTFVSKVMSLLSNTLSRFDMAFLLRSKHLLISRLHVLLARCKSQILPTLMRKQLCREWPRWVGIHGGHLRVLSSTIRLFLILSYSRITENAGSIKTDWPIKFYSFLIP